MILAAREPRATPRRSVHLTSHCPSTAPISSSNRSLTHPAANHYPYSRPWDISAGLPEPGLEVRLRGLQSIRVSVVPVAVGGRGRTVTGPRDRLATAECQCRIDGQRPVTEWGGTCAVSGRAQVGSAISDGYLHPGGLGFAPGRIGGHDLVRLIPGCAASRGSGRRSLPGLWRGSPTNDLASRPTRTGRTPTHSHSGQFMTRMHPNPISRFHRHPLRLGPAPHSPHRASAALGPPRPIVTIGSIPLILILANHSLPTYLVTASASFPRA